MRTPPPPPCTYVVCSPGVGLSGVMLLSVLLSQLAELYKGGGRNRHGCNSLQHGCYELQHCCCNMRVAGCSRVATGVQRLCCNSDSDSVAPTSAALDHLSQCDHSPSPQTTTQQSCLKATKYIHARLQNFRIDCKRWSQRCWFRPSCPSAPCAPRRRVAAAPMAHPSRRPPPPRPPPSPLLFPASFCRLCNGGQLGRWDGECGWRAM